MIFLTVPGHKLKKLPNTSEIGLEFYKKQSKNRQEDPPKKNLIYIEANS